MRILLVLLCWTLLAAGATPKTMATHRVVSAREFAARRSQGKHTTVKQKKWKKNRTPKKAHWGGVKVRAK